MSELLAWVLSASLLLISVPVLTFVVQVLLATFGRRALAAGAVLPQAAAKPRAPVAVLVPAHNETTGIATTVLSVLQQLRAGDRLLVVADNCQDDTAAVARSLGAEVTERVHATLRGKGYALDHGVALLRQKPPAMVLMLDADCTLHPGGLDRLAERCQSLDRPVQGCDLMLPPQGAALKTKIAALAWVVKNKVRPLGGAIMGWPCQLMGTGMIFPWSVIERAPLASGHLAEDMQLGTVLASWGCFPAYCDEALVTSYFPLDEASLAAQRTRWERGHLSVILDNGPRMLGLAIRQRSWKLLGMALDMCVPPLSSLVMVLSMFVLLAAGHAIFTSSVALLWLGCGLLTLVGLAVLAAWRTDGQAFLAGRELAAIPLYALSKVSIYAGFVLRRPISWVRTGRDHERK